MRREAELWIKDSDYDLGTAEDLLEKKRYNYAVFLARQSVNPHYTITQYVDAPLGTPSDGLVTVSLFFRLYAQENILER